MMFKNKIIKIVVYSAETNREFIKVLKDKPGVDYKGAVPYREVAKIMRDSDVVLIVEGFKKKDVRITRYSLSTKAADAMATGAQIFTYGSTDCGVIDYMASTKCSVVCSDPERLKDSLRRLIEDEELQKKLYSRSEVMSFEHHDKDRNLSLSESLFRQLIENG